MSLVLSFDAGFVSAFYFIFIDLLLLTILDTALARSLSSFYYRHIYAGRPLNLRAVDIPGVSNYIVGNPFSRLNLLALITKLLFIFSVLFLDLNITSHVSTPPQTLMSTFLTDASEEAWGNSGTSIHRRVQRHWNAARACFTRPNLQLSDTSKDVVSYFHLGFNLTNGFEYTESEVLDNFRPYIAINASTLKCLKPGIVREPHWMINVTGCSKLDRNISSSCRAPARVVRNAPSLNWAVNDNSVIVNQTHSGSTYNYEMLLFSTDEIRSVLPEYVGDDKETELKCAVQMYAVKEINVRIHRWCILVMRENDTTLFEKWRYEAKTKTLMREYAGPIFNRRIPVGALQYANIIWNSQIDFNWVHLSGIILAEASVYLLNQTTVNVIKSDSMSTAIPTSATTVLVLITITIIAIGVLSYIYFERMEYRPQLNSIDGISSIAREERVPSGKSIVKGSPLFIGLQQNNNTMELHFGPLRNAGDAVKIASGIDIV